MTLRKFTIDISVKHIPQSEQTEKRNIKRNTIKNRKQDKKYFTKKFEKKDKNAISSERFRLLK